MFKFNFDLNDDEVDESFVSQIPEGTRKVNDSTTSQAAHGDRGNFAELELNAMLAELPEVISYSPIHINWPVIGLGRSQSVYLAKRDLFDARFQLIASETEPENTASSRDADADKNLQYVDAPSDLVPGVYEGGLKTWECSADLAGCVKDILGELSRQADSLRALELGCGTAIPSLMLLREIFSQPSRPGRRIEIHLQDYNELVFRLVTLPNIILAWYMSPVSAAFISAFESVTTEQDTEPEPLPTTDPSNPGDLALVPALIDAFKVSLREFGITLRFFSGSWETFDVELTRRRYDVLLTSETIYRTDSLAALTDLMWKACTANGSSEKTMQDLEGSASQLLLQPRDTDNAKGPDAQFNKVNLRNVRDDLPICLVAAKLVYFGVGGGVAEFTRAVENGEPTTCGRDKGSVETIWKKEDGVKRVIMKVKWQ